MYVTGSGTSTAAVTAVPASVTAVTLLARNDSAKMRVIFNDSTSLLYVKWGTAASSTDHTVQLQAGDVYEFPTGPIYCGTVTGVWVSATGNARCTEG